MKKFYSSTLSFSVKSLTFSFIVLMSGDAVHAQVEPVAVSELGTVAYNKPEDYVSPQQSFLPGTLVGWSARLDNSKVSLKWTTTFEKNSSTFIVERSLNGVQYTPVTTLQAARNSDKRKDYSFTDNLSANVKGIVYYRLKMTDIDAQSKYSEVKIIRQSKSEGVELQVFPNPTVNELKITIAAKWQNNKIVYEIFNGRGQLIKTKSNERTSQTEIINVSELPAGIYVLKVSNGSDQSIQQFIKSNSTFHF